MTEGSQGDHASESLESRGVGDRTDFRDGKGKLYSIRDVAEDHVDEWLVGGSGEESPNHPFQYATQREFGKYDEDEREGDNLAGGGGIHLPKEGWEEKVSEYPDEVKEAIRRAIEAAENRAA